MTWHIIHARMQCVQCTSWQLVLEIEARGFRVTCWRKGCKREEGQSHVICKRKRGAVPCRMQRGGRTPRSCTGCRVAAERLGGAVRAQACDKLFHARRTVGKRMMLPTTEQLFWHCGGRTAKPESASSERPIPYYQNLLFSVASPPLPLAVADRLLLKRSLPRR